MTIEATLIDADYAEGAFGPTILVNLCSLAAVDYLLSLFGELAHSASGTTVELHARPEVTVGAAIYDLSLRVVDRSPTRHVVRTHTGGFEWSNTREEWETARLLIEPLLGQPGHQYLTSEVEDDALIVVSYAEHDS